MSRQPSPSRRAVLRGLGATLALPWLPSLIPSAGAGTEFPLRTLVVFVPNGMIANHWTPSGTESDFTLSETLSPLQPYIDDLLVISGLANEPVVGVPGEGHAPATGAVLTCRSIGIDLEDDGYTPILVGENAASMDQLLAQHIGMATPYPSLVLGSEGERFACADTSCRYYSHISWTSAATAVAKEIQTQAVFERLFGLEHRNETPEEREHRIFYHQSVLDRVTEQANTLSTRLGAADRSRLDEYLTGIREIEHRLYMKLDCDTSIDVPEAALTMSDPAAHIRQMFDLIHASFQCDYTRVCTYMMGNGASDRVLSDLGFWDAHHILSHHEANQEMIDKLVQVERWQVEQFAYLLERLNSTPEGDGTLLDHCQILFVSGMGDGNIHLSRDLPVLLAGKANGAIRTGRHLVATGKPLSELHMALMANAGLHVKQFGEDGVSPMDGLT